MKSLKLIAILVCLLFSINVLSQVTKTSEGYYEYELVPTGRIQNGSDTTYTVVLIMDAVDVERYNTIVIEDEYRISKLVLNSLDTEERSRQSIFKEKIKMDMSEWSSLTSWKVSAIKPDGTMVILERKPLKGEIVPIAESLKPKTRDLTFSKEKPVVENALILNR